MWTVGLTVGRVILFFSFTIGGCAADLPGTLPETVTDYTNAVVEPVRAYCTIHVVERMQKQEGSPTADIGARRRRLSRYLSSSSSGGERPDLED